jgi:hypothetical protein
MKSINYFRRFPRLAVIFLGLSVPFGCQNTPFDVSQGRAPLQDSASGPDCDKHSYEESLQGQHIFEMYCGNCHNARSLAERPLSNYQNVAQHMRVRANLTGEEYAKLMTWLRRWYDVPSPGQKENSSPNRFFHSQPINELRQQQPKTLPDLPAGPRAGATGEGSPGQPPPGSSPQEGR